MTASVLGLGRYALNRYLVSFVIVSGSLDLVLIFGAVIHCFHGSMFTVSSA